MEDITRMTLADILKDSNYQLTQFSDKNIIELEKSITVRQTRGQDTPYVNCLVRKREMRLNPEEVVRQLYVMMLINEFGYTTDRMELEYGVSFGREKKRADIVVFDRDQTTSPYIMVELKKPKDRKSVV